MSPTEAAEKQRVYAGHRRQHTDKWLRLAALEKEERRQANPDGEEHIHRPEAASWPTPPTKAGTGG
jgi:hypothetical protein